MTRYSVYVSVSQLVALYSNVEIEADNEDEARDKAVDFIENNPEGTDFEAFPDGAEGIADLLVQAEGVEKI